jgi:hypothetical protein
VAGRWISRRDGERIAEDEANVLDGDKHRLDLGRRGCRDAIGTGGEFADKKVLPGNPRQVRTNYRCSDQGLAGFACRTSTAPDSPERQNQHGAWRNSFLKASAHGPYTRGIEEIFNY